MALANSDEVIATIRSSKTQAEAKEKLMKIECPAAMLQRALGDEGLAEGLRDVLQGVEGRHDVDRAVLEGEARVLFHGEIHPEAWTWPG